MFCYSFLGIYCVCLLSGGFNSQQLGECGACETGSEIQFHGYMQFHMFCFQVIMVIRPVTPWCRRYFQVITPWKIHMEPTNHPFREENDLPNIHEDMFHVNLQVIICCKLSFPCVSAWGSCPTLPKQQHAIPKAPG